MGLTVLALLPDVPERLHPTELTFVVPLQAAVVELTGRERLLVDRSTWAVVPSGIRLTARAMSSSSRVLVFSVRDSLTEHVVHTYGFLGVERPRLQKYLGSLRLLPRTIWVNEICHRYFFEGEALEAHDNEATRFLDTEILKEAYFLCRDHEAGADRAPVVPRHSRVVERALDFIELNLLHPDLIDKLARHAAASESTLLRAFKRELGTTPAAYWRARRLDEALVMLRSGRESIGEVAGRVGYENPSAFAGAFQLRFGQSPSAFLTRRPFRSAP